MWYRMDDESVAQVGAQTVLKQQAYVLFYIRDTPVTALSAVSAAGAGARKEEAAVRSNVTKREREREREKRR